MDYAFYKRNVFIIKNLPNFLNKFELVKVVETYLP